MNDDSQKQKKMQTHYTLDDLLIQMQTVAFVMGWQGQQIWHYITRLILDLIERGHYPTSVKYYYKSSYMLLTFSLQYYMCSLFRK